MPSLNRWVATALLAVAAHTAAAQGTQGAPFKGTVASIRTTQPVPMADVRLMWVDSVHTDRTQPGQPGELFVDTTRSRIAITESP